MSEKGSKENLNESNMPLLSDDGAEKAGETPEKEEVELEEKDETTEKEESKEDDKKTKKEKKEKKEKKVKVPKPAGPSCVETMTTDLDMAARDKEGINIEIDLDFADVLAEPNSAHGFDPLWRLSFILFSQTKLWLYRILSALLVLPLSIVWAVIFALATIAYVWMLRPLIKIAEVCFAVIKRVWVAALGATVEPLCTAVGAVFANCRANSLVQSA